MDNFYGNVDSSGAESPRYIGATTYSRIGATSENATIDLLGTPGALFVNHAQVRKPGNNHMHGYEWESKLDIGIRVFHPRNALTGPDDYGPIAHHYKETGFVLSEKARAMGINRALTYKESKELGLTVSPPEVSLNAEEKNMLENILSSTPRDISQKLARIYSVMNKNVKDNHSLRKSLANPYKIRNNSCYISFLKENKALGKCALAWLFNEMFTKNNPVFLCLFEDLTFDDYGKVFGEIVQDHFSNRYTADGTLMEYSPGNSYVKLIKYILADTFHN